MRRRLGSHWYQFRRIYSLTVYIAGNWQGSIAWHFFVYIRSSLWHCRLTSVGFGMVSVSIARGTPEDPAND